MARLAGLSLSATRRSAFLGVPDGADTPGHYVNDRLRNVMITNNVVARSRGHYQVGVFGTKKENVRVAHNIVEDGTIGVGVEDYTAVADQGIISTGVTVEHNTLRRNADVGIKLSRNSADAARGNSIMDGACGIVGYWLDRTVIEGNQIFRCNLGIDTGATDEYGDYGFLSLAVIGNYFEDCSIYAVRGRPKNADSIALAHGNVVVNTQNPYGRGIALMTPLPKGCANFNFGWNLFDESAVVTGLRGIGNYTPKTAPGWTPHPAITTYELFSDGQDPTAEGRQPLAIGEVKQSQMFTGSLQGLHASARYTGAGGSFAGGGLIGALSEAWVTGSGYVNMAVGLWAQAVRDATNGRSGTVDVNGTAVTWKTGATFSGLKGRRIVLDGQIYEVDSTADDQGHMTLKTDAGTLSDAPWTTVFSGRVDMKANLVTWKTGPKFASDYLGKTLQIAGELVPVGDPTPELRGNAYVSGRTVLGFVPQADDGQRTLQVWGESFFQKPLMLGETTAVTINFGHGTPIGKSISAFAGSIYLDDAGAVWFKHSDDDIDAWTKIGTNTDATTIQGRSVSDSAPNAGDVLAWGNIDPDHAAWIPGPPDAVKLRGRDIGAAMPADKDVLVWDEAAQGWTPGPANAARVQGVGVDSGAPAANDVLRYDGSKWKPDALLRLARLLVGGGTDYRDGSDNPLYAFQVRGDALIEGGALSLAGTWLLQGADDPEGTVVGARGSLYLRSTGELYVKISGFGDTGWYAVTGPLLAATDANTASTLVKRDADGAIKLGRLFVSSFTDYGPGTYNVQVGGDLLVEGGSLSLSGTWLKSGAYDPTDGTNGTSAPPGSLYLRTDTGELYVKNWGFAKTGWVKLLRVDDALSGDVTGNAGATVVSQVGGKAASVVAQSVTDTAAATSAATPNTLVKRDGSGNFIGNASGFSGSLAGDVTGAQASTVVAQVGGKTAAVVAQSVADTAGASSAYTAVNAIVKRDANGASQFQRLFISSYTDYGPGTYKLQVGGSFLVEGGGLSLSGTWLYSGGYDPTDATNGTSAPPGSIYLRSDTGEVYIKNWGYAKAGWVRLLRVDGALTGDVTGSPAATVVSSVGGKTAAQVAQSVADTQAATSGNTPNTIVKRDGSGIFGGKADGFTGNLTGDVTGPQATTIVASVGGKTAAQVAQSVTDTQGATSAYTGTNALVKRDAAGASQFTRAFIGSYTDYGPGTYKLQVGGDFLVEGGSLSLSGIWAKSGSVTPEGANTAPPGSIYLRGDTGDAYVKNWGYSNTGWVRLMRVDDPYSGDVTGNAGATVVGKLQGRAIANTAPVTGNTLRWSGSQWAPAMPQEVHIELSIVTGAITPDVAAARSFSVVLTEVLAGYGRILAINAPVNDTVPDGATIEIFVLISGSGSFTLAWNAAYKGTPQDEPPGVPGQYAVYGFRKFGGAWYCRSYYSGGTF